MTTTAVPEKLDFKTILPVFVIILIDILGLTIIIPLLPLYAASFGANAFMIGALGASYPLMQFVGAPVLGRWSDKIGRRPVLIISQIGTFSGFIILALSNTLGLLFLARLIDGLSGANIATAQAVITDRTTEKTRTQGLGLIGAAFGLGFIIGPVLAFATLSLTDNNYQVVAYLAAFFSLCSILLTSFWLEESLPPDKRGQDSSDASIGVGQMLAALRRPEVGFLLTLIFAQQFAFGGFEHLLALFTLERLGMNASSNAALFLFAGLILVVVQGGLVGKWSQRFGDRWLILMGLSVLGVGLMLVAFTPHRPVPWYTKAEITAELSNDSDPSHADLNINLPDDTANSWLGLSWLMLAIIPVAVAAAVLQPSINSILTRRVPATEAGSILGISTSFYSASNALTPVVLGAIFEFLGSTAPFLIGGILLVVLWGLARRLVPPEPTKE